MEGYGFSSSLATALATARRQAGLMAALEVRYLAERYHQVLERWRLAQERHLLGALRHPFTGGTSSGSVAAVAARLVPAASAPIPAV
jgi:hypothetical protein